MTLCCNLSFPTNFAGHLPHLLYIHVIFVFRKLVDEKQIDPTDKNTKNIRDVKRKFFMLILPRPFIELLCSLRFRFSCHYTIRFSPSYSSHRLHKLPRISFLFRYLIYHIRPKKQRDPTNCSLLF